MEDKWIMLYRTFQGEKLSLLGFGTMRLPTLPSGEVDEQTTRDMVKLAFDSGVNYFDTAYPYHSGTSERVIGRALADCPRESFYLATKYPGHQVKQSYDPAAIFEEQLKKCGVDYFDFYLLHNVYEGSLPTYLDERWGIIPYFLEQKRLGRIRHLGFSSHGHVEMLRDFLDAYGDKMEFCQIQLNYLDWTLQDAKAKYELLAERGIPVWVMEPVRGGRLARLSEEDAAVLHALRPDESPAAWGFRFLQDLPAVGMVLSGMSTMEQMRENIATFSSMRPLSEQERNALLTIAEGMKKAVPCTACRYCCDGCPKHLDIPTLLNAYNELTITPSFNIGMFVEALPADKRPDACIACGRCTRICPQSINVPAFLRDFSDRLSKMPSWAEICRQRDAAQK